MPWRDQPYAAMLRMPMVLLVARWIGLAHVIAGLCILIEPAALLVSSFAGLHWIIAVYSGHAYFGGTFVLLTGLTAMLAGWARFGFSDATRLRLIIPQVMLLVFTLGTILLSIILGRYPDGYTPAGGTAFILADQSVVLFVALFHVTSILLIPLRNIECPARMSRS